MIFLKILNKQLKINIKKKVIFLGKEIDLFFLKESETNGNFVIRRLSGERIVSSPTYYKCFHLTL